MQVVSETEGALLMDGPVGRLEARVEVPRKGDQCVDLLICHPHPLYGGTMDNKVVHTLSRAGRDSGCRAIRFNFRGVGNSAGRHDDGRGEVDDLLAVIAATRQEGRLLLLAGFSFGAWVAASAVSRLSLPPGGLMLVAPPVHYTGFAEICGFADVPVQVMQGTDDDVVDPDDVRHWCETRSPVVPLTLFTAGHFFHGSLPALKEAVEAWMRATLSHGQGAK